MQKKHRFYIILQGAVNIYRLDDDAKPPSNEQNSGVDLTQLDNESEKRDEIIAQLFGNYVVTLGK